MPRPTRVAYLTSRFPKLSETFVVDEINAVHQHGIDVELFPLIQESEALLQADAAALATDAHFQPFLSRAVARSALAWLREDPRLLRDTVAEAARGVAWSRKHLPGLLGTLPKTLHFARLIRDMGIDHVHAHFAHHPALAAMIIHRLTGIPFSFTGHGHDVQVDRTMLCEKVQAAAFVVAISEHNRDLMASDCPALRDKISVLHVGVDPDVLGPAEPTPWARSRWFDDGVRVLAVGRLEPVKGHSVLMDALGLLHQTGDDVQAMVVGDGPEHGALTARRSARNLDGRVQLAGPMTRDKVIDLMRSADVVVLPSVRTPDGRVEGIPVVLMEAMSLGVPVIASDLPGVRELVEHDRTGMLFPAGDPAALAETIRSLAVDGRLRERLIAGARQTVIDAFNGRTVGAELADRFRASAAPGGVVRRTRRTPPPARSGP